MYSTACRFCSCSCYDEEEYLCSFLKVNFIHKHFRFCLHCCFICRIVNACYLRSVCFRFCKIGKSAFGKYIDISHTTFAFYCRIQKLRFVCSVSRYVYLNCDKVVYRSCITVEIIVHKSGCFCIRACCKISPRIACLLIRCYRVNSCSACQSKLKIVKDIFTFDILAFATRRNCRQRRQHCNNHNDCKNH